MKNPSWRYAITNTFGTLGYISLIIQWAWCLITFGHPLFSLNTAFFLPQAPIPKTTQVIDFGIFTPFISLFALFITILIIILTIITLFFLPRKIGKTGSTVTHVVASQIIKKTHHHQPLPAEKRIRLSFWIIIILKVVAIYAPFALVFITPPVEGLTPRLVTTVGFICAVFSIFYFSLQLLLSFVLRLDKKKIW
jgi:hypothetical protein